MKVQNLRNKMLAGITALAIPFIGGCETTSQMQSLFDIGMHTVVREGIKGQVNPDSRGTTVNVNTNANNIPQRQTTIMEPEIFSYVNWIDINENGMIDEEEIFGKNKKVFDFNGERFGIIFGNKNYNGNIIFRSWTSNGKLIGETNHRADRENWGIQYWTAPSGPTEGDFMDEIRGNGPGDYRITATLDNGKIYYLDVKLE